MEGIGTKSVMAVILMLSLVVVQANHSSSFHLAESNLRRGSKVWFKMLVETKTRPYPIFALLRTLHVTMNQS